ncbi:(d)CMP kinase [Roseivirga pacifica]|uniref:(d)CMP kinase n=1 Tax=Roseivirga pacifica TaxID=1267423 RepID=UPI0020944E75|nr:(d)CMP kinase [Roseivirga pacifica]MCO6357087.1 (d)CMP kinase [Roseivirga pacifica]MCO6368200.1 (d)CMP kinase [Roseivirga pacifica]MCO6369319.1 (d)CMP kinase [Roseivirga pacifica]MCO6373173.1 (d)CMP kinase [Roseivirga pacifica]MCO6377570.1 (d)CMP kinase [Roseivirga pacifica]
MSKINIAIDGHSGCGKSSTAKAVAKALGYKFIDTGAMYRAITLYFLEHDIDITDEQAVKAALDNISIDFQHNPESQKNETFLNEQNVEEEIRGMRVTHKVSNVAALKQVRVAMVAQQQAMGKEKGVVMDGRDIGSVVFPDAELKVFMTASTEVRAKRRQLELKEKGQEVALDEIIKNLEERDRIDSTREEGPLLKVADAVAVDTSEMKFEDQVQKVLNLAQQKIET